MTACNLHREAYRQSIDFLEANELKTIYILTAIGSKARLWQYIPPREYMDPMFGLCEDLAGRSAYVEARSHEAYKLRDGFEKILADAECGGCSAVNVSKGRSL